MTKHFDYIEEAHVTASDKYYGNRVSLTYFHKTMKTAIEALQRLDEIKKTLFYGRDCGISKFAEKILTLELMPYWVSPDVNKDSEALNIIHAIIGKATEAGELLEALLHSSEGKPFDETNALEEVGDGLWYDALLLRAIGSNFSEAQQVNIAKLRKRFPNAFTEFDANNRDLFEERKILENKA